MWVFVATVTIMRAVKCWRSLCGLSSAGDHCAGCQVLEIIVRVVKCWRSLCGLSSAGDHCAGCQVLEIIVSLMSEDVLHITQMALRLMVLDTR